MFFATAASEEGSNEQSSVWGDIWMWKLLSRFATLAVPWWVAVLDSSAFFMAWFYLFYFLLGQKHTGPLVIELWCVFVEHRVDARLNLLCMMV